MDNYINEMRSPEEGTPTGAGPGTGVNASDQRPRNSRRLGRGHPEMQLTEQRSQITTESPPAESAALFMEELTQAGLPRRRIQWTYDMNVSVMKAFFRATRDGAETLHYRQQMRNFFLLDYPNLCHLSQQNLSDRRRAIERRNLIPPTIIEQIRTEVQNENTQQSIQETTSYEIPSTITQPEQENTVNANRSSIIGPIEVNNASEINHIHRIATPDCMEELVETIVDVFNTAKAQYMGVGAEYRPYVPKPKINRQLYQITALLNSRILPIEITTDIQYQQIIDLLYCSAYTTATIQNGHNTRQEDQNGSRPTQRRRVRKPQWQIRIERKIENIRKDLGFLISYRNNKVSARKQSKLKRISKKHLMHTRHEPPNETIDQFIDTVKQKLDREVDKYRKYIKSYNRRAHNVSFNNNEKRFYNTLKNQENNSEVDAKVPMAEIESFWSNTWSINSKHNKHASWLTSIRASTANINYMGSGKISNDIFKKAISRLHNWKQPGPDKIHNFYYKYLQSLHQPLLKIFNNYMDCPSQIPTNMCKGITYLKPKIDTPTSPSHFRPITCLNTGYKLFTACLTNMITCHLEANNIMAIQQKGCRAGSKGCKDQLVIDSIIVNQAIRHQRNMYAAFIDYQKAFDSIPHSWIIETLKIYKLHMNIVNCVGTLTKAWGTQLSLNTVEGNVKSDVITIKRGIYQGDSLSPLLFCLALNPLSHLLETSRYGYQLRDTDNNSKVSHSLYMDDLKLYASTSESLQRLLKIVEIFSKDIDMKFGVEKCKTQNIHRGKFTCIGNYTTSGNELIKPLRIDEFYKYLGVQQSLRIEHTTQKKTLTTEFVRRLRNICKMKLNGPNITKAINTYAIPLLTYSFGIISWSKTDLNSLDRMIRATLTKYNYHHPRSAVERINLPRGRGGRGILNITVLHDKQINSLRKYFMSVARTSILYNTLISMDNNFTPLNLGNETAPQVTTIDDLEATWKSKAIHGKYPHEVSQEYVDVHSTHAWLKYGTIFPETEGHIVAIQDGVISTRNYLKYVVRDQNITTDLCRMCGDEQETISHIISGCRTLAVTHYKVRHDLMGKIIHIEIAKKFNFMAETPPYYKYHPQPILENESITIYWDRSLLMTGTINGAAVPNRPDMVIVNKLDKTATIIDFANPLDTNIVRTIETKTRKYHPLSQYLKTTRNLDRVQILPVIISSTGTIPKRTVQAISCLNLKENILIKMQKAVLIQTSTIVRDILG